MNEELVRRAEKIAARRAAALCTALAARINEDLPGDVRVIVEEERIVIRGRRIGMRMLRDPRFAVLRDGLGAGL